MVAEGVGVGEESEFVQRGGDTRQRLLSAALQLIWQSSYGTVSVDDICAAAGARKGSFYHYFESKSHLMAEAMETHWQEMEPHLQQVFAEASPVVRLSRFVALLRSRQEERQRVLGHVCGCPFSSVGSELSGRDSHIRQKTVEIGERWQALFLQMILDGQRDGSFTCADPKTTAQSMLSFILGTLLQARIENDLRCLAGLEAGLLRLLGTVKGPLG